MISKEQRQQMISKLQKAKDRKETIAKNAEIKRQKALELQERRNILQEKKKRLEEEKVARKEEKKRARLEKERLKAEMKANAKYKWKPSRLGDRYYLRNSPQRQTSSDANYGEYLNGTVYLHFNYPSEKEPNLSSLERNIKRAVRHTKRDIVICGCRKSADRTPKYNVNVEVYTAMSQRPSEAEIEEYYQIIKPIVINAAGKDEREKKYISNDEVQRIMIELGWIAPSDSWKWKQKYGYKKKKDKEEQEDEFNVDLKMSDEEFWS